MANLEKVIRITEDDYSTLLGGGTITKDGVTYTYDESALYVIQNEDPPAYAETAGVANTAVADTAGNNIANTYATKANGASEIEIDVQNEAYITTGDTINSAFDLLDSALEGKAEKQWYIDISENNDHVSDYNHYQIQESYNEIGDALNRGIEVIIRFLKDHDDNQIIWCYYSYYDDREGFYCFEGVYNQQIYSFSLFSDESLVLTTRNVNYHTHGNITSGGDITATAPTIANGDQIVINDHSASKITNGPTFDGSTTTQALSKKGTWESFAKPTMVVTITRSGTAPNYTYTANKTYTEIGAALEAGTNVVLVQNNYYYWFYAKGSGSTPDLVFKSVSNADMQPVSDGSINYIQSYRITINSSNTLTLSSDIIDLTGKVDKVTSTDNAIARYDGTGGQIQNSGVTINDSNQVTAAKFITSGGTSSQVVLGDGTLKDPKTFLDKLVITPQLSMGSIGAIYSNQLNNAFYALNKRKTITGTGFASFYSSYLFNNIGEVGSCKINAGETAVITIGSENDAPFATYTYGWIYVTFYTESTKGTAQSVSIRAYGTKGGTVGWHNYNAAVHPEHLNGTTVNNCFRCYNDLIYSIKAWEITIVAHETLPTYVSEVFAIFTRSNGEVDQSVVTKYANAQTLYGNITIDATLTADTIKKSDGTASQFLKANGSVDSTAYAPLASPALTGTPTAPTAASGTNTTQIATTAFVQAAISGAGGGGGVQSISCNENDILVSTTTTNTTSTAIWTALQAGKMPLLYSGTSGFSIVIQDMGGGYWSGNGVDATNKKSYNVYGYQGSIVSGVATLMAAASDIKAPLIIPVPDENDTLTSGTYASITTALAAGREVLLKATMATEDDQDVYLHLLSDETVNDNGYYFCAQRGKYNWTACIMDDESITFTTTRLASYSELTSMVGDIETLLAAI